MSLRRQLVRVLVALPLMAASSASAGEYHVYGCKTPSGQRVASDGWATSSYQPWSSGPNVSDPAWPGWIRSCAGGGWFGAAAEPNTAPGEDQSGTAAMEFQPGGGLLISRGVLYRALTSYGPVARASVLGFVGNGLDAPALMAEEVRGNSTLGNPASPLSPANRFEFPYIGTPGGGAPRQVPARPLTMLIAQAHCSHPCADSGASFQISQSDLVLLDAEGPTVDVAGGTLLDAGQITERIVAGQQSVTVAARDAGAGVDRLRVEIDGVVAGDSAFRAVDRAECKWAGNAPDGLPAATVVRPCPPSGSATVAVDTAKVPDGRHQMCVLAADGSGTTTVVAAGYVLVRNTDVVGPGSPDEFRGSANGTLSGEQATLIAGWAETARAPSKSPSIARRCKRASYRKTHTVRCEGRAPELRHETRWSRTKSSRIVGLLVDAAGTPVPDAAIDLGSTSGADVAPQTLGTVTTAADGSFSALAPRAPGSQLVHVAWRARRGDTIPAASQTLMLKVTASSSFQATSLGVGRTARFKGRVAAGDLVASDPGPAVRLQWWANGRWSTFETAAVDRQGRWSISRRLNVPATYRMRVAVEDSPRGLFEGRTGPTKLVRVR